MEAASLFKYNFEDLDEIEQILRKGAIKTVRADFLNAVYFRRGLTCHALR